MKDKILTLIIPAYNMEAYLPACLGSLANATEAMPRLQVLVVNDGSNDRTSEIAHEFAGKYPLTIEVIDKSNGHYGSCVNAALPMVKGVYVKVLDADDSFFPEGLTRLVGRLDGCARNNVDVVFTDYTITDGVHDSPHSSSFALPRDRCFGFDELVSAGSHMVMHPIAYKTDLLKISAYRQTEGISYTDNEWAALPMRGAKTFVYFPVPVYRYLVGREGQSVSAEQTVRGLWMLEKVLARLLMECDGLPEDNLFRRYVRFFASHNATLIYRAAFFELPIKQANAKIERWDATLAERMPETYKDLAALSLLNSTPFRFEYVKRWRSAGALRNWPIRIARMIHAVEKFVGRR